MKVFELNHESKCSKKTLTDARTWLRQNRQDFKNVANFAVFHKGSTAKEMIGDWCHREMVTATVDRECVATEIGAWRQSESDMVRAVYPSLTIDTYRPYVDWLVNKSFASPFILNKDDFEECLNYGIVVSSDCPSPLVQNILLSSRYVFECNPASFYLFNDIVSQGYPGSVAYAICFGTNVSGWTRTQSMENPPKEVKDDTLLYPYGTHRAWGCWSDPKTFKKFGMGDFSSGSVDEMRPYREYATIFGGKAYTGDKQNHMFTQILCQNQKFKSGLSSIRGEGIIKSITNPFKKKDWSTPVKEPHDVTISEMLSYVLPYLKSEGYFDDVRF